MIRIIKQEEVSPSSYEKNNGNKMTVPDQAQGLHELLQRFRRGELPAKKAVYNMDAELPDLKKMDLVDVDDLKRNIQNDITNGKAKEKQIKQAYNDLQKQQQQQSQSNKTDQTTGTV